MKQSPALPTKKPKVVVPKENDVVRVDVGTATSSILDKVIASAVAGVNDLNLEEEKKRALLDSVDASIRNRLSLNLESLLVSPELPSNSLHILEVL